jgi:hypothetical protein
LVTGGDNAACVAKKFFGKKWVFFQTLEIVLEDYNISIFFQKSLKKMSFGRL